MLEEEERIETVRLPADDLEFESDPPWAQLASAGQLKAAIVEYIRANGDVLIPELAKAMQPYMEVKGDQGIAVRSNPNTVIWVGLSQSLCESICELISTKRLYIHPTEIERYNDIDEAIRLPILKEPVDERVPRPSWLPSAVRTGPHPVHSNRLARLGRIKWDHPKSWVRAARAIRVGTWVRRHGLKLAGHRSYL